ncbi:MAG: DEAD/DEAH box helicase [Azonexaceae bacterium]|nr:DEAD/DEAH box helicase [Azonexaceae bacterium]
MSSLRNLLNTFRTASVTEREKGTYFEELILCYLRNEATYKDLYTHTWSYAEWAKQQGIDARDTGIDLVAQTATGEYHAIQCKLYAEDYRLQKGDIDSFFTASGKKPFTHRVIVSTTNHWSEHAENALCDQQPPVSKIDLHDLENSQIDWDSYAPKAAPVLKTKKQLREHQQAALAAAQTGLATADRGKLIMACGTGKTFTALKIAETLAGKGKRVLFLVPSLNLLSQTLTEWTQESETPLHSFAVCSDSDVGKKRKKDDDTVQTFTHELRYPATTEPGRLATEMGKRHDTEHMSVVFSTYHSIEVISRAQLDHALADFDLIICDEAHRTTGVSFGDEDESAFVRVHNNAYIRAAKRLYMTATPRIYSDSAEVQAEKDNAKLYGMNKEEWFGKELFVITFSEAVRRGLLCDYKVIVLAVEEAHVSRRIQNLLKDPDNQLKVDDAAKIIGCWKALSKQGLSDDLVGDSQAMQRAVAFCQVIEIAKAGKTHKVSSKQIASMFQSVVEAYQEEEEFEQVARLNCEAAHVDGSMNASEKEAKLAWLKDSPPDNTCRILSNVRCLSEGVDVPALDAVLFLTPRNSQVDVVQSVGRVMRNAPGKKRGYVILPVVIPAGVEPHEALNDNQTYKVVWQVLQALRSHDDRFDAMVNKLDLIGKDTSKMEVIAITDKIAKKQEKTKGKTKGQTGQGGFTIGTGGDQPKPVQHTLEFEIGEIERAIYAKLVQKVGNRHHWEDWANDIAKIARTHIDRLTGILKNEANTKEHEAFNAFAEELRDDLNDSITDGEIIEMLAQHLITKPVFDALFEGYSFAQYNPMSQAMQAVLDVLQEHRLSKEADTLQAFYDSVKLRAEGIDSAAGKQKIIKELYDKFFNGAFPKLAQRLGIVYTPVEVVDFIISSVNHILQTEFGQSLGSKGVHILDPFTGTGTFITRLLQSGLITPEQLPYKYQNEIHANEIVLLAYYIAAINIEAVYHGIVGGDYQPFDGICLTDTFQMYEKEDMVDALLEQNSARRKRQKQLDIRVIFGNPPYSAGQEDENDNNKNIDYPALDSRIFETYIQGSRKSMGKSKGYDSYIRAFRWATDLLKESGVVAFVSGSGFAEKPAMDGMRKAIKNEFNSVYVFNLRGDIRKNILSKGRAKEGQNIFDSGSMTGIAITVLVKNPSSKKTGKIFWHDIGDDLLSKEKLAIIKKYKDIFGIQQAGKWLSVTPDEHNDWINQRDSSFSAYMCIGRKGDKGEVALFDSYSMGLKTNRDSWVYNSSKARLNKSIQSMISFYNLEMTRLSGKSGDEINKLIIRDKTKIKWTTDIQSDLEKGRKHEVNISDFNIALYRPFLKCWVYSNAKWNWTRHLMPKYFPDANSDNLVICVSGVGARSGFSTLITNTLPDLQVVDNGQCYPLYIYDEQERCSSQNDLFSATNLANQKRRDALTDEGLVHFQTTYSAEHINKEDVFYYVYGLLHSPDYRERYADNLSKELPRIPRVKSSADFWAFSQAGRKLADLHLNYETVEPYPLKIESSGKLTDIDYRVEKMKYGKKGKDKDLTTLHYNDKITLTGIPLEAYDYVVNGKPALDWVVERQCVKTDKDSGIVNDANDWAVETMNNPRYPLELFMRVVTVSLETMKIVRTLPNLDILEN